MSLAAKSNVVAGNRRADVYPREVFVPHHWGSGCDRCFR